MKLLETEFVSGMGAQNPPLTYKQVCRQNQVAVYERSLENKIRDYEVIIIRIAKAGDEIFSKVYEEDIEFYPGSSQWGRMGFSFHGTGGKEAALKKMERMIQEQQNESAPEIEKVWQIPNEFSTNELATKNQTNYIAANLWIKENLGKTIKLLREERRAARGKLTKVYGKI